MEKNDSKACRICFDGETKDKKLISPCLCKGSSKYIHKECLYTWINSQNNSEDARKCEICNYSFDIKVTIQKKCNLKVEINDKVFKIICIIVLILMLPSLAVVIIIVISKNYITPQSSLVRFIGFLLGFAISFLCILTIIIKMIQAIFCITTRKEYIISSIKTKESNSKKELTILGQINQTTELHEMVDHREISLENK
ncbi:hypothetical protein SteCoe_31722 [Stentor coeruleus]|uniref:RING-CH-type domain-containing protein n=1 Tax=Stentor coeruleus TaxID=5963 RepID=A0A1R2B0M9_9CILI|nr:hypothetical protein SteCoe_31722 [Stentor coeruleus]